MPYPQVEAAALPVLRMQGEAFKSLAVVNVFAIFSFR